MLLGIRSFRETILNALADRKHLIYCQLPEGNFFVDPSDRVIGSSLMWQGRWQWEEIDEAVRVLKEAGRLKDDSVFVDVGANIGTQTVHALRAGPFSRGVAFEPENKNAKLLNMNLAANGMAARVTVFAKAAGATDGEARALPASAQQGRACDELGAVARHRQKRRRPGDAARHDIARLESAAR